ncbi:MAG: uroporphyrinogen decarboxylase family protein, partial [Eubacteriales bacterium]
DWMVDLQTVVDTLNGKSCVCGNYDPVAILLQGSLEEIDHAVRNCARIGGKNYISAAGCEVPKFTPPEHLMQVHKTLLEL